MYLLRCSHCQRGEGHLIANPISTVSGHADFETTTGAASQRADSSYTIVGYRTMDDLIGFCLDTP